MADHETVLRRVAWTEILPFLRLMRTPGLALSPSRLLLALGAVVILYLGGRVLDGLWGRHGGVLVSTEPLGSTRLLPGGGLALAQSNEIEAYVTRSATDFSAWRQRARQARHDAVLDALEALGHDVEADPELQKRVGREPAAALLLDRDARAELSTLRGRDQLPQHLAAALERISKDPTASAAERERRRRQARLDADSLLRQLTPGYSLRGGGVAQPEALRRLVSEAGLEDEALAEAQRRLTAGLHRVSLADRLSTLEPSGPFITLLDYEARCFAAAVRAALAGRWGFAGGVQDEAPSMLGCVFSAAGGAGWLVTQRPLYAGLYSLLAVVVLGLAGGAVCRSAALAITREHPLPWDQALGFAREKLASLAGAPLMYVAVMLAGAVALGLGGLIVGIPWIGDLLGVLFFPLALIGGLTIALALLGLLLGVHLTWPTIAVEGTDVFDAMSRSGGYLWERMWSVAGYSFFLLLIAAPAFLLVRLIATLMLKLTHVFAGAGLNAWDGIRLYATAKLDAIWRMPSWSELTWLPTVGGPAFWGEFRTAPLGAFETLLFWFVALYVFLVVGLVGAFVLSYYFSGATLMYLLLRRQVDATDWDDVYFIETDDEINPAAAAPTAEPKAESADGKGTPLKVLGGAPPAESS